MHIVYTNPPDWGFAGKGVLVEVAWTWAPCDLAQKTNVREDRLCGALTIAEVHRVAIVALAALVQADQQLQDFVAIGHAQVALVDLIATNTDTHESNAQHLFNIINANSQGCVRAISGVLSLPRVAPVVAAGALVRLHGDPIVDRTVHRLRRLVRFVFHIHQRHGLTVGGALRKANTMHFRLGKCVRAIRTYFQ